MSANSMTKLERLMAARAGEIVERVPVSLWHHWPGADQSAETLAESTIAFQKRFDFDMIKVTPSGLIGVADWGVRTGPPYTDHGEPTITRWGVVNLEDWDKLEVLDPTAGRLAQEVGALRAICEGLGNTPFVQTIFLPLTNAGKLANTRLLPDLREHPEVIHRALRVITDTTVAFIEACIKTGGADGVFLSTKHAGNSLCTREEYLKFGVPYDLEVLERISRIAKLKILHLHGDDVYYDLFKSYPVDFLNWHDRGGGPSIAQAGEMFRCGLMSGIANTSKFILNASLDDLRAQARDAIAQARGRRLVIAPGCVLPSDMTDAQYDAIRHAVEV